MTEHVTALPSSTEGTTPTVTVSPDDLGAARKRWGLDDAPTAHELARRERAEQYVVQQAIAKQKREKAIALYGTPLDYARYLMAEPMPKEWREAIRRISPKSDQTAWLELAWKQPPGKPEKRRLVVYECLPDAHIPTEMRMLLGGTPYWEMPKDQRHGRERFVSAYQWEMYRTERVWARPYWCIQGDAGGTPLAYSELEQDLLRLEGQPTDPPALGALAFAPWDGRVEYALRQRDRLWKFGGDIERMRRENADPAKVQAEYEANKKEFRKRFLAWWGDKLQEQTEFLAWYETKCEADHTLRRATKAEMLAASRLEEEFIEHGTIPTVRPWENH